MEWSARPRGWIEVIAGGMFSGKTEALITRLRRALIARQTVQAFKPRLDDRYEANFIVSHSRLRIETQVVESAEDILECLRPETQVVGIDEGQFLGQGWCPSVINWPRKGGGSLWQLWTWTTVGSRLSQFPICWQWRNT
ncbi:hypothetical protein [Chloracidobacterium thermophilum]